MLKSSGEDTNKQYQKNLEKELVKSILDGIKKAKLTTEVFEACESQRTASPTHQ